MVITAPGPGSGKMATCLSQLYHEYKRLSLIHIFIASTFRFFFIIYSALDTVEAASLLALLTPEERRLFTLRYTAGYKMCIRDRYCP